jgi:hypothetical protein
MLGPYRAGGGVLMGDASRRGTAHRLRTAPRVAENLRSGLILIRSIASGPGAALAVQYLNSQCVKVQHRPSSFAPVGVRRWCQKFEGALTNLG